MRKIAWKRIYTVAIFVNAILLLTVHNIWKDAQYKEAHTREKVVEVWGAATEYETNISCHPFKHNNSECQKFILKDSDPTLRRSTFEILAQDPRCSLPLLARDCSRLINDHSYIVSGVSEEETAFPLAFGLKMHTAPDQAEQLLRTIYRPHNVYCIYVDGKANDSVYNSMKILSECFNNVHLIEERIDVVYASIAHVHSELQCMRMCTRSDKQWKYYINLTGQEFPLRTNLEMVAILKSLRGKNVIESYTIPYHQEWRHKTIFEIEGQSNIDTTRKKEPFTYNMEISKGSAYGLFSRKFVEFILSDKIARDFILWLNDTYAPEETVWATLNTLSGAPGGMKTEVRHTQGTFLARAVTWQSESDQCHGEFVRGVCVYGANDLQWLADQPQFIANKFNRNIDPVAIDCLEHEIRRRTHFPEIYNLKWSFYHDLPQAAKSDEHYAYLSRRKSKKTWINEQHFKRDGPESYIGPRRLGPGHTASMFFVYSNGTIKTH